MSITAEAPAARDARNLLTAKEFVAVAATVQRANPRLDQTTAGRVVTEGLKFVATAAARLPAGAVPGDQAPVRPAPCPARRRRGRGDVPRGPLRLVHHGAGRPR
ncbi:hypothetical protein GCM10009654_45080 [Streptomyces hebeiensis]|uniref:Uncharacterized protein n=1 Tax=Streptomyces hebeiensis TaxID=229486 RepID=A0ABN1UZC0_9ACTN